MSSMALARPAIRQSGNLSRMAARRFQSNATTKATEAAKDSASKATEAAKETVTKVSEATKQSASKATEATKASEATKQSATKATEATKETASKATEAAKESASKTSDAAKQSAAKASEAAKEAAAKATASASEYAAKAQQGLSRVSSAAGPAISGAAKGLANSLGKVGGRTGRVVGFAERQIPQVLYWGKVGSELAKLVFRNQKMSPPSVQTFQSYYQTMLNTIRNPSALAQTASKASQQPASMLQQVRNVKTAQLIAGGVVAAECLGFFTVGEMIGRFKIIGYHGEHSAEHH